MLLSSQDADQFRLDLNFSDLSQLTTKHFILTVEMPSETGKLWESEANNIFSSSANAVGPERLPVHPAETDNYGSVL